MASNIQPTSGGKVGSKVADYRKPLTVVALLVVLGGVGAAVAASHSSSSSSGAASASTTTMVSGQQEDTGELRTSAAAASGAAVAVQTGRIVPAAGPDIIRTGSMLLSLPKGHLQAAFDAVTSDTASEGGFVADTSTASQDRQRPTAELVVRVPSGRFNRLMVEIAGLGKVESQQVQGQDVTGQLVNLSARITNLQAEEEALRTLVETARSVPNILRVQNELFTVESEIEQLSAQQASLDNQTTYATLTVNLQVAAVPAAAKPKSENTLVRAVKLAGHNVAVAGRAIVLGVGWAFPLIVLAGIALVVWRLKRRRGMTTPSPAGS